MLYFLLAVSKLSSQVIPYSEARKQAESFFTELDYRETGLKSGTLARTDTFLTCYASDPAALKSASVDKESLFYIFNRLDKAGFVILPAEKRVGKIIAWSAESRVCEITPVMKTLLDQYTQEISLIRERNITPEPVLKQAQISKDPLLGNIQWSQSPEPFNALCPYDNATARRCPAGCVATAMAQIIYYYKYPRTGTGSYSYKSAYGYESADFSAAEYRYEAMSDKPVFGTENEEIAELTYHCAVAVGMEFGPYSSAAFAGQIASGLEKYFKYKKSAYISRSFYTPQAWRAYIRNEIDSKRPVVYSAVDPLDPEDPDDVAGGHAFVVDGYDENDLFHINWGWDGCSNGYYSLDLLSPATCNDIYFYSDNHAIVSGIEPLNLIECLLSADRYSLQIPSSGGQQQIAVSSNTAWTASSGADWLSVTPGSANNNGAITLVAAPNPDFLGRTAVVTIKGCDISRSITIVQDGTCLLTISLSEIEFPVSGGSKTGSIVSSGSWMVTGSPSWVTVTPDMGNGDEPLTITAAGNAGFGERSGTITLTGCSVTKSIEVNQQGSCSLSLTSNQEEFSVTGGSGQVGVTTNSFWEVSADESWVSFSPEKGNGDGILILTTTPNTTSVRRTATLTVKGCNTTRTISISQPGVCFLEITPLGLDFSSFSSMRYVTLNATSSWSVVNHEEWISVKPSSGTGTSLLAISVASNATGLPRSGTVTVSGCSSLKTIKVEQQSDCVIEVSSALLDFGFMPGSKSLSVNSSTRWTASADVPWISISPKSGSQTGNLTVDVQANTSGLPRSGTIEFSGCLYTRVVRVEQSACTFALSQEKMSFSAEPGIESLVITSNAQWSAISNTSWLTLSSLSGKRDGTTTVMVEANTSGKRSALITVTGCFSSSRVEVIQEALATPVSAVPENLVRLYPSPTKRFVNVEIPLSFRPCSLEVYSGTGRRILMIKETAPGMVVDLAGEAPGCYFFRFTTPLKVHTAMVVLR